MQTPAAVPDRVSAVGGTDWQTGAVPALRLLGAALGAGPGRPAGGARGAAAAGSSTTESAAGGPTRRPAPAAVPADDDDDAGQFGAPGGTRLR